MDFDTEFNMGYNHGRQFGTLGYNTVSSVFLSGYERGIQDEKKQREERSKKSSLLGILEAQK